eukprot:TRINITY_DN60653_c0_g1_i6.p4 TRINITY_DN60653_c0_g1~~TRINITY_DN60653_c0_g1_i6.p4  ORF type:complete len:140 (-),score=3.62 TRINITY_DN60653_c0_g1_i6:54-473(-)
MRDDDQERSEIKSGVYYIFFLFFFFFFFVFFFLVFCTFLTTKLIYIDYLIRLWKLLTTRGAHVFFPPLIHFFSAFFLFQRIQIFSTSFRICYCCQDFKYMNGLHKSYEVFLWFLFFSVFVQYICFCKQYELVSPLPVYK